MTTAIPGGVLFYGPPLNLIGGAAGAVGSIATLAGANQALGFVFQAPKTGTIERVAFEQGAGSAGTNTKRVSLQDVGADGFPDNTADQWRLDGSIADAWITTGILSSDGTDTGTQRAVTQGDWLAVVWDFTAYTTGSWIIEGANVSPDAVEPYSATRSNVSTWAINSTTLGPSVAVKYATLGWVPLGSPGLPVRTLTTTNLQSTTTPDEVALRFIPDRVLTVCGLYAYFGLAGDHTAILYDSSSNILASATIDKDFRRTNTAFWVPIMFNVDVDLTIGATYRLALVATDANISTHYAYNVADTTTMGLLFGGAEWYASTRTDSGAWSDTTTRRYFLYPMVRGFL